ncbi:unnamed protein product [Didymodactylos carnosus]|uniref:Huntingtin n=1 Tax=Didymodactylos carnosus TaxID=1234261 RepID=A0A813QWU1_9BILA|nr:unnamed protein product [Didymodactylos carnosus]CAF0827710.1 unnamed protein product [Didymodactylos carnosus]CAF3555088.1 unnamed protein product [Didymodactylos carnosus]CAF3612171.1 unnamed protein product [Didymodactylos carnosus]
MDKLSKSLELLKTLSLESNNEKSKFDAVSLAKEKIHHLNLIVDVLLMPQIRANNDNYFKILSAGFEALFLHCDEQDYDVRLAAEENTTKLVKSLKEVQLARVQVELHRIIKRNPNVGPRALKGALWRFSELAAIIHPKKIRPFLEHLYISFCSIASRTEELLYEKLPDYYQMIFRTLGKSMNDKEVKDLLQAYLKNLSNESAVIRRSSASCLVVICRHCRQPLSTARFLLTSAIENLLQQTNIESRLIIIGSLSLVKNLIQMLGQYREELLASTVVNPNTSKREDAISDQINTNNIIECVDILFYLFGHSDHNIVSGSLEALETILRYSFLFEFDHILMSTGPVAENHVTEYIRKTSTDNVYRRPFIETTNMEDSVPHNNVDATHTQLISLDLSLVSSASVDQIFRSSATRFLELLISRFFLNTDGTLKSDDEVRVSIKCAALACMSHLATIDIQGFYDSTVYGSEIVSYLLCLREHVDLHLRGAFSSMLANLIQTSVRLWNCSLQLSSTSSLSSSFLFQCSMISIDSQKSSRFTDSCQILILQELLNSYRLCLNDTMPRVVHVSVQYLKTLLPVLISSNSSMSMIALCLLEDCLQHINSSYVLVKIAIAQLIGVIDFRLVYFVEQQYQQTTTRLWLDRCVEILLLFLQNDEPRLRNVAAVAYAKLVDQSSFMSCTWPTESLLKLLNSNVQWIYNTHEQQLESSSTKISPLVQARSENISCLSTIIFKYLGQASTRIQLLGYLEGIYALSAVLSPTTIMSFFHNNFDELRLLIHFLKHPFILHDLNGLQLLLEIIQVLFENLALYFSNNDLSSSSLTINNPAEKIFHFIIRLLSIYSCIVDETPPPMPTSSKINFPQIPASPQQIKKRFENATNKDDSNNDKQKTEKESSDTSPLKDGTNNTSDKKSSRTLLGQFGNNPSLLKLYELIRASYQTYKCMLNSSEIDRFTQLLATTLTCLQSTVNLVHLQDISKHLEEILTYLKSTFVVDKTNTILCTQELLHTLLALTNTSIPSLTTMVQSVVSPHTQLTSSTMPQNVYTVALRQPMLALFQLRKLSNTDMGEDHCSLSPLLLTSKKRKKIECLKRPPNRIERQKIGNYIRLFETVVILGLKKYVNSNEIQFQASVLDLLVQLLLLRVNYSLLDADEHFLKHVLNQLEVIEEAGIGADAPEHFIACIFEFLVMLSHDSLHSKQVIKIQDLNKHTDSVLASGNDPQTHALTALEPVVVDLFLVRFKNDNKELEAHRIVIVQTLLKLVRYKKALQLLTLILDSVKSETEKWKKLSRQIVDVLLISMQSAIYNKPIKVSLELYSAYLQLFDVVSSAALRPVDPLCSSFKHVTTKQAFKQDTIGLSLINVNVFLRCLIQHANEDAILQRWKESPPTDNLDQNESFSALLLRILYDVTVYLLKLARQSRCILDNTLCALTSDYLYLILNILENARQFRSITNDLRYLLVQDDNDIQRLDNFSYLTALSDHFKQLSFYYVPFLIQWTQIMNLLDYTNETWWKQIFDIGGGDSHTCQLANYGQLIIYCDLICRHELCVEHLTSILTNRSHLVILFEHIGNNNETHVQDLISLIHRDSAASNLYIEAIFANWNYITEKYLAHNGSTGLFALRILRTLEAIHLDQSGILLLLLIEHFLQLPYMTIIRLAETIICQRIEMMLTIDIRDLEKQLLPKHLPLILKLLSIKEKNKRNERLMVLVQRMAKQVNYNEINLETESEKSPLVDAINDDSVLNMLRNMTCPNDITAKMYATVLASINYKKLLPYMMSLDFIWTSMPYCLRLGFESSVTLKNTNQSLPDSPPTTPIPTFNLSSLWRCSINAMIKKINDVCFSLPAQRLICSDRSETTQDSLYMKSLSSLSEENIHTKTVLLPLCESLIVYFGYVNEHNELYQLSVADGRDILRFIIFISETIYINLLDNKLHLDMIEIFFQCIIVTLTNSSSIISTLLSATDQIVSCCTLLKSILTIFQYIKRHIRLAIITKRSSDQSHACSPELIEHDQRPQIQLLLQAFYDIDQLYDLYRQLSLPLSSSTFLVPKFIRKYSKSICIILFRLPVFNSFFRIPTVYWQHLASGESDNGRLQFSTDFCLTTFPVQLLQHSDIMTDYIERLNLVGWINRTQFQETWVTFLASVNQTNNITQQVLSNNEQIGFNKDEKLEENATHCIWVRGVTTFLLNAIRKNSSGNPSEHQFEHHSRNKQIPFLSTTNGEFYLQSRMILNRCATDDVKYNNEYSSCKSIEQWLSSSPLFVNVERIGSHDHLSYEQFSLDSITKLLISPTSPSTSSDSIDRLFSRNGLDLNSSLQILLEIYMRWMRTDNVSLLSSDTCLQLRFEIIRSFVQLSDLFTSVQQLSNLFDLCDELIKPNIWVDEDELVMMYVCYGLCKSGALLGQTLKDTNELYIRLIERCFKSFYTRSTAYASALILLQTHEDDLYKYLLPMITTELTNDVTNNLQTNIDIRISGQCLAFVFYCIENTYNDHGLGLNLLNIILQQHFEDLMREDGDYLLLNMVAIGIERLLLLNIVPRKDLWPLFKQCLKAVRNISIETAMPQLILLLACIYITLTSTNENDMMLLNSSTTIEQPSLTSSSLLSASIDDQEMEDTSSNDIVIELVSDIYERTKYTFPHEASRLLSTLPSLLCHISLSDKLMNKIIAEYAATQQLYPQILAYVIFTVFRSLINANYLSKVNEWTLLSISSVSQRRPIRLALWALTCLMLSACEEKVANSLFPLAVARYGRSEDIDNKLFLAAGREYYMQLTNNEQQKQFEQSFTAELFTDIHSPYTDLFNQLKSINLNIQQQQL